MNSIQERIETVLSKHHYTAHEERNGLFTIVCGCDNRYGLFETYRAHVAVMVAPIIREAQAKALTEFADAHRMPQPLFMDDGRAVTAGDLLREKAAQLRSNDG